MRKALLLCSLVLIVSSSLADTATAQQEAGIVAPRDNTIYKAVVNHEEQYSIWPADRENPLGWNDAGKTGTKEECLAYVKELWEKMRPEKTDHGDDKTRTEGRKKDSDINVEVKATKTNLRKGESAVVTVIVNGLKGIKRNVWLWLEKQGVVSMGGGDVQSIRIRHQDVRPDGTFEVQRTVTGKQAGGFNITATVLWRPWEITLVQNAPVNGYRVKKKDNSFTVLIENAKNPLKGDPLDGEYVLEYPCVPGTFMKSLIPVLVRKGKANINLFERVNFCKPDYTTTSSAEEAGKAFEAFNPRITMFVGRFDF
ncbi:MAG TPA: MbtH family protein [Pyrinomonadaceae bacterium]